MGFRACPASKLMSQGFENREASGTTIPKTEIDLIVVTIVIAHDLTSRDNTKHI